MKVILGSLMLLLALNAAAGGPTNSGGGFPANALILSAESACPSGWTEVTTYAGRFLVALPASGNAGDTLGNGIATTASDITVSATANACTATAALSTVGGSVTTCASGYTPTVTMNAASNNRSELAPFVSLRLCRKG